MPEKVKYFDEKGKEVEDPEKAVRMVVQVLDSQGKLIEESVYSRAQSQGGI
jgi:hypothetical protein